MNIIYPLPAARLLLAAQDPAHVSLPLPPWFLCPRNTSEWNPWVVCEGREASGKGGEVKGSLKGQNFLVRLSAHGEHKYLFSTNNGGIYC